VSIVASARAAPRQRITTRATIVAQMAGMRKRSIVILRVEVSAGARAGSLLALRIRLYRTACADA
jgi:hypothetical protein